MIQLPSLRRSFPRGVGRAVRASLDGNGTPKVEAMTSCQVPSQASLHGRAEDRAACAGIDIGHCKTLCLTRHPEGSEGQKCFEGHGSVTTAAIHHCACTLIAGTERMHLSW